MLIRLNFFSFIIGNFYCWANFFRLVYFVLDIIINAKTTNFFYKLLML